MALRGNWFVKPKGNTSILLVTSVAIALGGNWVVKPKGNTSILLVTSVAIALRGNWVVKPKGNTSILLVTSVAIALGGNWVVKLLGFDVKPEKDKDMAAFPSPCGEIGLLNLTTVDPGLHRLCFHPLAGKLAGKSPDFPSPCGGEVVMDF
jgi:hypothetical protein